MWATDFHFTIGCIRTKVKCFNGGSVDFTHRLLGVYVLLLLGVIVGYY